jgi:hypothetical protein
MSIAIQKKSFIGGEFRPYNKIKLLFSDRRAKSNEKRVGAKLENVVPGYIAYPPPFSLNVRPSTSQLGPSELEYCRNFDVQSGKLFIEDRVQSFIELTAKVELIQSGESRILIPTKDVRFVSIA